MSLGWFLTLAPLVIGAVVIVAMILRDPPSIPEPQERPWYVTERRALEQREFYLTGERYLHGYDFGGLVSEGVIPPLERVVSSCKEAGLDVPTEVSAALSEARSDLEATKKRIAKLRALEALVDAGYAEDGSEWGLVPSVS